MWIISPLFFCFAAVGCISGLFHYGTSKPDDLNLDPRFRKGDQYLLHIVRNSSRVDKPNLTKTIRVHVQLRVLEESSDGYVIQWTGSEPVINDQSVQKISPESQKSIDVISSIPLELYVDKHGNGVILSNWDDVKSKTDAAMRVFLHSINRPQYSLPMDKMLSIKQRLLEEPTIYFLPLGRVYSKTMPARQLILSPSPFDGDSITISIMPILKSFDSKKNRAVIEWRHTFDHEEISTFANSMVSALMPDNIDPATFRQKLSGVELKDEAEYTVDTATGWTRKAIYTRTYKIDSVTKVDSIVFSLNQK